MDVDVVKQCIDEGNALGLTELCFCTQDQTFICLDPVLVRVDEYGKATSYDLKYSANGTLDLFEVTYHLDPSHAGEVILVWLEWDERLPMEEWHVLWLPVRSIEDCLMFDLEELIRWRGSLPKSVLVARI